MGYQWTNGERQMVADFTRAVASIGTALNRIAEALERNEKQAEGE